MAAQYEVLPLLPQVDADALDLDHREYHRQHADQVVVRTLYQKVAISELDFPHSWSQLGSYACCHASKRSRYRCIHKLSSRSITNLLNQDPAYNVLIR